MGVDNIKQLNSWWESPKYIKDDPEIKDLDKALYKYKHPLVDEIPDEDCILTLRGPRQIGKSTTIKQIIEKKLEEGVDPYQIFFYPCDDIIDFKELMQLLASYFEIKEIRGITSKRSYILLDEVTLVKDWQRGIKALADRGQLQGSTVLLTGSSTIDLEFSSERMPGRRGAVAKLDYEFLPLDIYEYLELAQGDKVIAELDDYMLVGGFPKIINEYHKYKYISDASYKIYLDWIIGEIHRQRRSERTLFLMLKYLTKSICSPTSLYKIAQNANASSHETAADYLRILQQIYVLFPVERYSIEQEKYLSNKNMKWYFTDPFILGLLFLRSNKISDNYFNNIKDALKNTEFASQVLQNSVLLALRNKYQEVGYYRDSKKREVDFIATAQDKPQKAIEVKLGKKNYSEYKWFTAKFKDVEFEILNGDGLCG